MATSKSKSAPQILQDFVGSLLNQPEIEINIVDKEQSENDSEIIQSSLLSEQFQKVHNLINVVPNGVDKSCDEIIITAGEESREVDDKVAMLLSTEAPQSEILQSAEKFTGFQQKIIPSPLQDGVPEWGKGSFKSLIFNIGELKLAVPLTKLGGIHKIDYKPTPMPDKPAWCLGIVADPIGNISLINSVLWMIPEKYDVAKANGLDYELFIVLDKSRWGLACTAVDSAITVSEKDIRWNHKKSKRPWLAGMIVEEMCALVDVDTLLLMLDNQSQ
jgi:purine-binding chemotaxis protein CheW